MNAIPEGGNLTYPHGFLDFLALNPKHDQEVGGHRLEPAGLERLNAALRALSPESPHLTLAQVATAGQRALDRYPDGGRTAFVTARLRTLALLEAMCADPLWDTDQAVPERIAAIHSYRDGDCRLLPDAWPVLGGIDVAVLVDVAAQLMAGELTDYEDYCRFRQVSADFAGIPASETGIGRQQWLQALSQATPRPRRFQARPGYAPDPRATLFRIG